MVKCDECQSMAKWMCKCSNALLCEKHAGRHSLAHFTKNKTPELKQISFAFSDKEKNHLQHEVENRKEIIKNFKLHITNQTLLIITKIKALYKQALLKLNNKLVEYTKLLKQDIYDISSKEKIERIFKTTINQFKILDTVKIYQDINDAFSTGLMTYVSKHIRLVFYVLLYLMIINMLPLGRWIGL